MSSPHWMSSKTATSGCSAATRLEQLAERPGDLVRREDVAGRLAEQRARSQPLRRSSAGSASSCFEHLHDRPVGDPLPVREAAAADDRCVERGQELRHEPRLPDAGLADDRDELAAPFGLRALPRLGRARAPARRPTNGAAWRRSLGSCTASEPQRRHRLATSLSARAARRARPRPRLERARSVVSPTRIAPGSAACSSRAATLTASPVASRSSVPVTTSPVVTPIRPSRPRPANASRISTAARQARSASSSCTAGTPKTAITASPMNFSTEPPWRSTIACMRSK